MKHNFKWARDYYQERFGERVQKIPINAGFTCPNRDGTLSTHGCSYCNNDTFTPFYTSSNSSITEQFNEGVKFFSKRYSTNRFLAYFQAFSNTYAPINTLKAKYEEALSNPLCEGLVIATRPDCINEGTVKLLTELSQHTYVKLELGVESFDNNCLKAINRGHSKEATITALNILENSGIDLGIHLIFGLPEEKPNAPKVAAETIGKYNILFVKLHHLQIVKNSTLARDYEKAPLTFSPLTMDEYLMKLAMFIKSLQKTLYIERLINRVPLNMLIAPKWGKITENEMKAMLLELLSQNPMA